MTTSSTRSNVSKKTAAKGTTKLTAAVEASAPEVSEQTWRIAALAILAVATFLRVYDLNLVPLHHDEGVNGNFLVKLVRDGAYQYDPANYHGPTLYYFSAFVPWVLQILFGTSARETYGLNTIAIRLVPAIFGIATVWLILLLRRHIGTVAALTGALLLALSPGAVYLSRYFIHETLFVFFTLGLVVAALRCYTERSPVFFFLATASAALLFATKETAFISIVVLLIALAITLIHHRVASGSQSTTRKQKTSRLKEFADEVGGPMSLFTWVLLALLVFMVINIVFYSSFFKNYPKGIYDALRTFDFWSKTGKEAHVHPFYTYVKWLLSQETPLLLLAAFGGLAAFLRPRRPVALFCALWAFGLLAAYSLVPYKTPWLALNFIVPLAITAGFAIESLYELDQRRLRLALAVLFAASCLSVYKTIDLNFVNYDNDDTYYVYVYAHTRRETNTLVEEIDKIAAQRNHGTTGITIMSPDYWPLPWYLRNYSRVGYFGRLTQTTEPIVIASGAQRAEVEATLGNQYELVSSGKGDGGFTLRPGVELLLYVKRRS